MAFQMVYTSVRSGLVAGRSGFCTAARHREIKESLVARLEDFSAQYDRGIAAGGTLPVVYQHRIVTIRDQRHHALMRLGDAGNDYTGRTNHIAHCLVVEPSEIAGLPISPAEAILALSQRGFWRSHYDEPARFFGAGELIDLGSLPRSASLPAARWRECTGSSANAAQLFDSGAPADAGIALAGTGEADAAGILALFAESLLLLDPGRSSGAALWSVPFTTVLQSSAERSQFRWCGIVADSGPSAQEVRAGRRILSPGSAMNPPSSALADIAEGRAPRVEPVATVALEMPPAGNAPTAAGPGEMAGVRTSAAGQVPERVDYAVPLSLEDPRRRQRKAKARKNPARTALLCAAAVVVMLAMAGGFVYWNGKKALWEEEKRIAEMAERGEWEEIQKEFNGPKLDSEKHPKWAAIANAMARYEEIEKNPDQFRKTMPGKNTVDEVIGTIQQEWRNAEIDSSDPLVKQVEEKRIAAIESAKKWKSSLSNAKNGGAEPQTDPSKYSKASPETNPKPEEKPAESEKSSTAKNTETTEASKSKTEDTLEEKTPALTIVVPANGSGEFILTETDKHKIDNNAFSEINILALSTLFDGEEEATSNDLKLNLNGNYYDNERNLILKKTVITPPEKEGLKLVKKKEEKKEQKKREKPFWDSFPGGFILIPRGADRADDVRYLVLDKIPGGQGSETLEPWAMKPCERFLKRGSPGEVEISESVVAILKTITRVTGDPPKYRLTLAGDFPIESEWVVDPSAIRLPGIKKVRERLEEIAKSKKLQERAVEARESIETRYANLGTDLFPQFFESSAPNEVASKVDKKNPAGGLPPVVLGTFPDFAKGAPLQFSRLTEYIEYVKSLFASLDALSEGSAQYNRAHQHIEKYIEKASQVQPVDGLPKEAVAWYELTRAWSASPGSNPPPSTSDGNAKQTDRDAEQIQRKYFDDFFRVWNERFSEKAVKKLIDDLNLIQATQALPSPEQLDSTLKALEATKSRLENNDLNDDGKYTLELMLETPNPASPQPFRQTIPLIRGTR